MSQAELTMVSVVTNAQWETLTIWGVISVFVKCIETIVGAVSNIMPKPHYLQSSVASLGYLKLKVSTLKVTTLSLI